jgi:phosphoenolpyruvate carboxykinase (ATP)
MTIKTTRSCIDAIIDGTIKDVEWTVDPVFGFEVPKSLPGLEDVSVLDPRSTWADKDAFDKMQTKLAGMYVDNFKKYEGKGSIDYTQYGPKI